MTIAFAAVLAALVVFRRRAAADPNRVVLQRSPDTVKRYLERLLDLRVQITDHDLRATLLSCCGDVEAYFSRYSGDRSSDAEIFTDCLGRVVKVVEKYVDVQDNGRYYDDPTTVLRRGKSSVSDFAAYVLQCCKNRSSAQLSEYTVNAQILQAQRLR